MSTQQPTQQDRRPLERGWTRWRLIRDVADGSHTGAQLARRYGVDRSTITRFSQRYAAEIDEVRAQIADEMAGLWIAEKRARLAEYQQDVDDINGLLARDVDPDTAPRRPVDEDDPDGPTIVTVGGDTPALVRAKARVLRQVAEEMGHLPARVQVQVNEYRTQYAIEGVDLDQLR